MPDYHWVGSLRSAKGSIGLCTFSSPEAGLRGMSVVAAADGGDPQGGVPNVARGVR